VGFECFAEIGARLLLLGRARFLLFLLGGLLLALGELGLQLFHLVGEVGGGGAVLAHVPEIARDVLELVAEELFHRGLGASEVLLRVGVATHDDGAVGLGGGVVDALVVGALALQVLLALLKFLDLVGETRLGLVEVLVAPQLVELGEPFALLLVGLVLSRALRGALGGLAGVVRVVVVAGRGGLAGGLQRALEMLFAARFSVSALIRRRRGPARLRGVRPVRGWGDFRRVRRRGCC
jgi:hypothetical protein